MASTDSSPLALAVYEHGKALATVTIGNISLEEDVEAELGRLSRPGRREGTARHDEQKYDPSFPNIQLLLRKSNLDFSTLLPSLFFIDTQKLGSYACGVTFGIVHCILSILLSMIFFFLGVAHTNSAAFAW
jgi:hypothetical protein